LLTVLAIATSWRFPGLIGTCGGALVYAAQASPGGLDVFTVRAAAGAVLTFAFAVLATQLADYTNS
jgi:hypothetical protein